MRDGFVVVFAHVLFDHSGKVGDGGFDDVHGTVDVFVAQCDSQIVDFKADVIIGYGDEFFEQDIHKTFFNFLISKSLIVKYPL